MSDRWLQTSCCRANRSLFHLFRHSQKPTVKNESDSCKQKIGQTHSSSLFVKPLSPLVISLKLHFQLQSHTKPFKLRFPEMGLIYSLRGNQLMTVKPDSKDISPKNDMNDPEAPAKTASKVASELWLHRSLCRGWTTEEKACLKENFLVHRQFLRTHFQLVDKVWTLQFSVSSTFRTRKTNKQLQLLPYW